MLLNDPHVNKSSYIAAAVTEATSTSTLTAPPLNICVSPEVYQLVVAAGDVLSLIHI